MPEVAAAEQRFLSTPVSNIFGNAAGYDRFMGRWSQLAAHLFIDFVRPPDHGAILDLGCGTGSLSLAMTAVRPNCRIMGIDRSPEFVSFARNRVPASGVQFQTADAQSLPFFTWVGSVGLMPSRKDHLITRSADGRKSAHPARAEFATPNLDGLSVW